MKALRVEHTLTLFGCPKCQRPWENQCPLNDFLNSTFEELRAIAEDGTLNSEVPMYDQRNCYMMHEDADENPNLGNDFAETYKKMLEIRNTCPYNKEKKTK